MIDEIKLYLERGKTVWDWWSREAARGHVERDVPGVVRPWTQRQANLAYDLRPHVQSDGSIFPLFERQRRPVVGRAIHLVLLLPVDEIGKRPLHSLEHASRFILCSMKSIL